MRLSFGKPCVAIGGPVMGIALEIRPRCDVSDPKGYRLGKPRLGDRGVSCFVSCACSCSVLSVSCIHCSRHLLIFFRFEMFSFVMFTIILAFADKSERPHTPKIHKTHLLGNN